MRWGRTTCPSTCDTTLVYSGRVGGTFFNLQGGAADYLCLPNDPEYSDFVPGVGGNQERQVKMWYLPFYVTMKVSLEIRPGSMEQNMRLDNSPTLLVHLGIHTKTTMFLVRFVLPQPGECSWWFLLKSTALTTPGQRNTLDTSWPRVTCQTNFIAPSSYVLMHKQRVFPTLP